MKTKAALKYLELLIKNFYLVANPKDNELKYLISRKQRFFCLNQKDKSIIVSEKLCCRLQSSFGIESEYDLINLFNKFFKKNNVNIFVASIYILDFDFFTYE